MPKQKEKKKKKKEWEEKENVEEQENEKVANKDDKSKEDGIISEEIKKKDKLLSPPFPKSLQSSKVVNNATKIFEVLKQVKVNIPFFAMIKQVLPYANFLKELSTMKRG